MARYKIKTLNYLTAGKNHAFINIDAALDYQQPKKIKILDTEQNSLSIITLDQGNIEYINTEYISKETEEPLSLEKLRKTIVLKEDQKYIKNIEAQDKSAILLKTTDDIKAKIKELIIFQQEMSAINNLTYEFETDINNVKNNLLQNDINRVMLPLYDIKDLSIKSENKKKAMNRLHGTNKYVDIYAPTIYKNPIKFCQANGFSYMLLDTTRDTPQSLNIYLNDNNDESYYMQINSRFLKTYAYSSLAALNSQALKLEQIDTPCNTYAEFFKATDQQNVKTALTQLFQPKINYSNLIYNYILDFDQNNTYLDYDNGDIYAKNINIAKNIYNSVYTIDIPNSDTINNTREYCNIGSMNNTVFLTYIDDIKYVATTHRNAPEGNIINTRMKPKFDVKVIYEEIVEAYTQL